jgi:AcrR family transcriptional regulator
MSTTTPTYARIAGELRERIDAGELAAGDRVPSAREITRHWGVAIATASRVLATLRELGLVRAVPGVGTVVVAPARARSGSAGASPAARVPPRPLVVGPPAGHRRAGTDHGLAVDRIVRAAVAIADAEGLAGLSMRRVAAEIGAAPMSLYRHVADKDDLLLRMMDAALREWPWPDDPPPGWRARLEVAGHGLWSVFRRHPWLAPALSLTRPQPIPAGIRFTEWVLAALDGLGLDLPARFDVHLILFNYVRGTAVNLEPEADAEALSGLSAEEWVERQQPALRSILDAGSFPLFARLLDLDYDFDLDALFARGLAQLLDGLAARLRRPGRAQPD